MGRAKRRRCNAMEPDCFNCPFEECVATMEDINRQEALKAKKERQKMIDERNSKISEFFDYGIGIKELSEMFSLSQGTIRTIIKSQSLQ